MSEPDIVDDFYGVYLLYNINPKYKGRTYIGYTRDPNRRIMQHNRGTWAGGAHRTNNKGPWKMVLIVHGFPNNISALRFEWAWQNPSKTTRLQHLDLKKIPRKESEFRFKLRVLSEMLRVGPWWRLPLSIRWLEQEYYEEFPPERHPPEHMVICYGPVKSRNQKVDTCASSQMTSCRLCSGDINDKHLKCLNDNCNLVAHIICLAEKLLTPGEYIPIEGSCPLCKMYVKWGDLLRKMKRCQFIEDNTVDGNVSDDEVILTQDKEFVDNNSWFLDCNEDL
ncbi:structure-specific endonuclease subunit SLX1 homolog [Zerene cesonia]|uniref:structure-specific endonuclease subunit SLX1 homolog n=1 Tax=Zerene cesonia TaxID=33412 RepID=UPI0018E57093|nr:structure-specific endonuclease subunit SLX1 homolog [Zerene cesonia]